MYNVSSIYIKTLCIFDRIGRKPTTLVFFVLGGLTGIVVGIFQFLGKINMILRQKNCVMYHLENKAKKKK